LSGTIRPINQQEETKMKQSTREVVAFINQSPDMGDLITWAEKATRSTEEAARLLLAKLPPRVPGNGGARYTVRNLAHALTVRRESLAA
jgi:hypothetical protein